MKRALPLLALVLSGAPVAPAQDIETDLLTRQTPAAPSTDPKGLIKASSSFLREREPEMTGEEYALYEQVVTMLTNNPEFAVRMLEAMMNPKEPPSPAFEFILGNAYYAVNQPERAEKSYRSAVARYPGFQRAWKNLGVLHYTTGRFDEAAKCFSKAVTLGDREPTTFGLLGYSLEQQGNLVSAEMAYLQALGGDPGSSDWKEGLLRIYVDGRQYGRAEPLIRSLIREKPAEKRLWLNYAGILVADRRKLEAMAVLEAAQAARAAGPDELSLLGDLYAEQGLAAEAVAIYAQVLTPDRPRGEQKLLTYARVLIAAGNHAEAERTLAAIKGEPTPAGRLALLQTRADLLVARKRWPEARREIEALLALAPLDGRALLTLGRTHLEEKDLPRATFAFEAAYRITESAYQASLELANIELKNRRYAKSASYLEHALKLQKSDAVEDYLARVKTLVPPDTSG
jgi:tetratricopeptide (TPR) repeat protein